MNRAELFVVPAERHVERLAREGIRAETRAGLAARLLSALLPDVRYADVREQRVLFAIALDDARHGAAQLSLFGVEQRDALLETLRARGGASWVRAVGAMDEAVGALRSRGATEAHLERVRGTGVSAARAQLLARAMNALDTTLARAGLRDRRMMGADLAEAIRGTSPRRLVEIVGASGRLYARWTLAWEHQDLVWWRALDETLARAGGWARVMLPTFVKRIEGGRERDPFEVIADLVARHVDAAPETEEIRPALGDFSGAEPVGDLSLIRAPGASDEARACARVVREALEAGAAVERIVIAYPVRDERTLAPLRRALALEGVVFHDALGPPPSSVPVIATALLALEAEESCDRFAVARLLRSGYIDGARLFPDLEPREATRVLSRLAHALETRATAAAEDPAERLIRTVPQEDADVMTRLMNVLVSKAPPPTRTRAERARSARALWTALGLASRAGRGALETFARDDAPKGVERAERLALATDVRAWELLEDTLDTYERALVRAPADTPIDAEMFRLELETLLELFSAVPNAGRAGAVRLMRLGEVAGEALDLLVVLDMNDGVVPRDAPPITLISEAFETALTKSARGAYVPPDRTEQASRDLAALAAAASEADRIVLITTAESTDAAATPARLFLDLERTRPSSFPKLVVRPESLLDSRLRSVRERSREAFFLDPARPESDVIGALAPDPAREKLVASLTGDRPDRPLAVTSLERFAQCPFRGYAHVVLAARETEEQRELPDAREEGNLIHEALAAAFVATKDAWPKRPRDAQAIVAVGLEAADRILAASEGHAPLRAIVRLRVRESVRIVLLRAIEDEHWNFASAEQSFGARAAWPPFAVEGTVYLRGSIDRVDRAVHGQPALRVIDYKRSKSTAKTSMAHLGETALQIPVYAAVAARQLGGEATGLYLPIQPRDLATEPKTVKNDRVRDFAPELGPRIEKIIRDARRLHFSPLPARESECTHCGVSGGCRKPRFAMTPADEVEEPPA